VEVDNDGVAIPPQHELSNDELLDHKKKDKKKPVKMTCSRQQMVSLLEELLAFHSWYKYGELPLDLIMKMVMPMISSCHCIK
jgi:hypothetical protein